MASDGHEQTMEPTLPASWYNSPALYSLERRAIFSKHWLQITHRNRFINPGDFARFEMAGYHFFISKDQEGCLRALHNVCRHRAFPVVTQEEGNARILSCGYHGWSYGLNGNLAKAPQFHNNPNFNKEDYSLLPIHLYVDKCGFIWVNFDAGEKPEVSWEQQVGGVDEQERLNAFDMDEYVYNHSWSIEGQYNWKALIDNYNECYHCSVSHPGVAATTDLPNYTVSMSKGFIAHFPRPKPEWANGNNANVAPTYVFPSSAATINTVYMYLMRCVPTGPTSVSMQYEVYRHETCTDADFEKTDAFMKQIEKEDRELCTLAQKNLNVGVYQTGPLHPHNETGVRYSKKLIKDAVLEHRKLEQEGGCEIWPAAKKRAACASSSRETEEEEAFCTSLGHGTSELDW